MMLTRGSREVHRISVRDKYALKISGCLGPKSAAGGCVEVVNVVGSIDGTMCPIYYTFASMERN